MSHSAKLNQTNIDLIKLSNWADFYKLEKYVQYSTKLVDGYERFIFPGVKLSFAGYH